MEWLTNERISILELAVTIFVPVFTFFMGRYTSYRSDCRKGMKELNSRFYQPFVTLYHNTRHAYAMNFVDLPLNVQAELVTLLLSNYECFSPFFKKKIDDLDQAFSGYSEELANGDKLLPDEEEYVEKVFESSRGGIVSLPQHVDNHFGGWFRWTVRVIIDTWSAHV